MTARSNLPEVRNPVLALPAMAKVMALPTEQRAVLYDLLSDIRREARVRAAQSLARNKHMVYAYWAVVAVYAGHVARALRRGAGAPA